jgi:uncharacterized cupredoxin-like copper-binding protein
MLTRTFPENFPMFALLFLLLGAGAVSPKPVFKPRIVSVHASEFAFSAPKTVPAGTITFHLVNDGKQLHHVTVVKLLHGKTTADYVAAMKNPGPPPAWAVEAGGPNAAVPGGTSDGTVTLEPGSYALVCFVPSPGEMAPHLMKGMVSPLTVTPNSAASVDMPADVDVRLSDYKFTLSKPLTAGHHWIRVTNDAAQPHELLLVKLPPGQTAAKVGQWVEDGQKGPPPAMPMGGASPLAKGRSTTLSVDLAPGNYGLICFIPDAKDGKPHFMHGMATQFSVK